MTTAAAPLIFKSPLSNNEPAALNIFYLLNPPQLSLSNSIAHFKGKCLKQRYWGHKFRQRNSPVFIQIGAGRFSYLLQRRKWNLRKPFMIFISVRSVSLRGFKLHEVQKLAHLRRQLCIHITYYTYYILHIYYILYILHITYYSVAESCRSPPKSE